MKTAKNGPGSIRVPVSKPFFGGNELKYVSECIETGWVSSAGSFVDKFESFFAKYTGVKHATSSSNGTTALHLALQACGIKKGDEVIVPDLTFIATASPVTYLGAKPVLADIDLETLNIDPQGIESKITSKTKAIIPVHLYGRPAPMKEIMEIAEKHGLVVIEDAAEAQGATIGGKKVGSFGHASIFSFYGNKLLTTGEGGMVVSEDEKIIESASLLKNHGMSKEKKYWHEKIGYNYRLTNIQAALGLAQLEQIEKKIYLQVKVAENYSRLFNGSTLKIPQTEKGTRNVYWIYWVLFRKPWHARQAAKNLLSAGIDSRPLFYPLSTMPPFKCAGMKNSVYANERGLCLPTFAELRPKEQEEIASIILEK